MNRLWLQCGALVLLAVPLWCADKTQPRTQPPPRTDHPAARPSHAPAAQQARPNGTALRRPQEHPSANAAGGLGMATAVERWNSMPPEERERQLQKLPPERQQQVRERLEKFNSLPKEEQDRLRARYQWFSSLPADRQQLLRRQIQSFNQLPESRRPEVSREIQQWRRLSEPERLARMNSPEFKSKFDAKERDIVRDLAEGVPPVSAMAQDGH